MTRVVHQLMNEVLVERHLTLSNAQKQTLIQPKDIERKCSEEADKDLWAQSRDCNGDRAWHTCLFTCRIREADPII